MVGESMKIATFILLATCIFRVQGQSVLEPTGDITSLEGDNITFTCTLIDGTEEPNVEISTSGSGNFVLTNNNPRVSTSPAMNGIITITFGPLNANDTDTEFQCTLRGVSSDVLRVVIFTPVMYDLPNGTNVIRTEGSDETIDLLLTAFPNPSFTWYFNGGPLMDGNGITLMAESITFTPLSRDNAGDYVVAASNVAGNSSVSFSLDVQYPPVFISVDRGDIFCNETSLYCAVMTGNTGSLSCRAEGNPDPEITFNSTVVNAEYDTSSDQFMITTASLDDVGYYNCFASNSVSDNSLSYNLQVGTLPNPVSDLTFAAMANEGENTVTITVSFNFVDDSGVRIQYFVMRVIDDSTDFTVHIPRPSNDDATEVEMNVLITMNDLVTGSYRPTVVARNLLGDSITRENSLEIPMFNGAVSVASISTLLTAMLLLVTALLV